MNLDGDGITESIKKLQESNQKKPKSTIYKLIRDYIIVFLSVWLIRGGVLEQRYVVSGSMVPTLLVGDYALIKKYAYGLSLKAFSFNHLPEYKLFASLPQRGDLVLIYRNDPKGESTMYVKRVIALPGEKIKIINGVVFIDKKPMVLTQFTSQPIIVGYKTGLKQQFAKIYTENLGGHKHLVAFDKRFDMNGDFDNYNEVLVPENCYFCMGDNRDYSNDSRADLGFINCDEIIGKTDLIIMSFASEVSFWNFMDWVTSWYTGFRTERFWKRVDIETAI